MVFIINCKSELDAHIAWFLTDNKESIYYSGLVNYYFKHFIKLLWKIIEHTFCHVNWYTPHINQDWFYIEDNRDRLSRLHRMYNVKLWGKLDKKPTFKNFLPVQRIVCRFIKGIYTLPGCNLPSTVVIPLNQKFSF